MKSERKIVIAKQRIGQGIFQADMLQVWLFVDGRWLTVESPTRSREQADAIVTYLKRVMPSIAVDYQNEDS